MRLVRVLVSNEHRSEVYEALDERDFDYVVVPGADRCDDESVVEIPVSDEGVGDLTESLTDAGVDLDRYLVVEELQWAATPHAETIRARYADVYDRPTHGELRSLVDKLNWDVRSFLAMMALSALVSGIGLVLDSPVIVVGSAVLAPLVNPMLITGMGTILGERRMISDSLRLQALGLVVAIGSAFAVGLAAEGLALAPATLDLPTLDMVETRLAPSGLAVFVGVLAGGAAAVSLTAESSLINIVGVMVAAALIPAAAAAGVALAWGYPLVALGSALLVLATVVAINLAILATLLLIGYRPSEGLFDVPSRRVAFRMAATVLVLGLLLVGTAGATAQQVTFEQDVNRVVDDVVSQPGYEEVSTVSVRTGHADYSPFTGPETVFVELGRFDGEPYADLPDRIANGIRDETDREVTVQVEFLDRRESS